MTVSDRVYGRIEISEPVIAELVNCDLMQRLKRVNQSGGTVFLDPSRNVSRFEHSIGVWYLLKRYGASMDEQIAGLLHDTPHTAFSHVIDYVFINEEHSFHEKFAEKMIRKSEVPEILKRNSVEIEKILDKKKFPLLEADLPDLSADRMDYFFRDTRTDMLFPDELVGRFLSGIFVKGGRYYFRDCGLATLYALLYMNAGRLLWLDPNSHGSYFLLANALKRALEIGKICEDDFFKTDEEVMEILRKIRDPLVQENIKRLTPKTKFRYANTETAEFMGPNKPRIVDPWVESGQKLTRVSDLTPKLKELFEDFRLRYKIIGVKPAGKND